jgi:TPR repeat protein
MAWVCPRATSGRLSFSRRRLQKGHTNAQFLLGSLYCDGLGVPQSYERAAELYTQAAAKGQLNAQTCQGGLYYNGKGVPKDVARGSHCSSRPRRGIKGAADILRALGEAVPPGAPA